MEEKKESSLFRQKSLDRISSPEELNDYVRVANPGVWLFLIAVTFLLIGFIFWCCFANLESTVDALITSDFGNITGFVSDESIISGEVKVGMTIKSSVGDFVITDIGSQSVEASTTLSDYENHLGNFQSGEWVRPLTLEVSGDIPDGDYDGKVVIENVQPISFILNNQGSNNGQQ